MWNKIFRLKSRKPKGEIEQGTNMNVNERISRDVKAAMLTAWVKTQGEQLTHPTPGGMVILDDMINRLANNFLVSIDNMDLEVTYKEGF